MPVYMIIETLEVTNEQTYSEYTSKAKPIILSYGGKYLASSSKIHPVGGGWDPKRIVIIEFQDMNTFDNCFNSPEYKAITHLRESSVRGKAIVVEA